MDNREPASSRQVEIFAGYSVARKRSRLQQVVRRGWSEPESPGGTGDERFALEKPSWGARQYIDCAALFNIQE